ncbi:unnamed protein product, partial [Rotaria sp. Silwood1]
MGAFLAQPTSHSHTPQSDRVPAIQLKNDMKVCAVITDEPTSSILHSALRTYPLSAAGELPSNEALMLMIRRQCTVETVDVDGRLPEKLRKTYCYEDFILHEDKNLIIFTTKTNLSILKQNKHWFADGTFKVCSNDYYQLFTLHAMMTNAIIPLVYALLIEYCKISLNELEELIAIFEDTYFHLFICSYDLIIEDHYQEKELCQINLDRILYDSIFTRCLTLIRSSSNMHIYSLTDEMLDRFCVAILSKIHHKIEELTVETLSMERVFLVDNYSDLHKLELVSIRLEELERQFD